MVAPASAASGEDGDSMISLPAGVNITWQLEDRDKDTWVVYSPEVQDALTAAAMVGNKQVNLMEGPRTSLVLDMKQMVQRNSKGVEKRVRGLVGSGDKLCIWEVNEGKGEDWDPLQVGEVAKLKQMVDTSTSVVVGNTSMTWGRFRGETMSR